MASDRKQLNVRLSLANFAKLDRLMVAMSSALNIEMSQADVVAAALGALEEKYPSQPAEKKSKKKAQESA